MTAPLALSMGDPAGIGPEICLQAVRDGGFAEDVVVVGDLHALLRARDQLGLEVEVRGVERVAERAAEAGVVDVLKTGELDRVPLGQVSAAGGQAAHRYIVRSVELIQAGEMRGLVTAPINKESLRAGGIRYPGHTELLADLAGVERVSMMLYNAELRVVLVSVHVALREAIELLDPELELQAIRMAAEAGPPLGFDRPRIAVAGLNPHAGEGGMFGDEESRIIEPAIERAREEGLDVSGPWPGDTVFMQARNGDFDFVVAQYHDQGLIPVKYLGLDEGVNVTLGLPFVRTSVDHGTAFGIAGKGTASPASLISAIRSAQELTRHAREKSAATKEG